MMRKKTKITILITCILIAVVILFSFFFRNDLKLTEETLSTPSNVSNIIDEITNPISYSTSTTPLSIIKPPITSSGLPRGVFSLLSPSQDINKSLNNPNVVGIVSGGRWQEIETSSGYYNWSFVDQEILGAKTHGKKVLLRINSGGKNTPSWALTGVSTFSFIDPNEYHSTYNQNVTIPVFWDPVFLTEKKKFIIEGGAHFAQNKIDIVSASCANATTNDWNTASKTQVELDEWNRLGFTPDKLINACEQIIDTTASSFPNSLITISLGGSELLDPSPNYISKAIINYASNKYPGRMISESNGLSATTKDTTLTGKPNQNPTVVQNGNYTASQMLWRVTDDPTCRMNGQVTPCDPVTMLSKALTTGAHLGKLYIEVYAIDIANPDLQSALQMANQLMGV